MSASTNPFITGTATGTGSANEFATDPEQHHPNNPFLRNTSTTIPRSESQQEAYIEPQANSNPFQISSQGPSSTMGSGQPIKQTSPFSGQQDSADAITQSLSGLDFGSGATSAPERQPSVIANPFSTTYPSPGGNMPNPHAQSVNTTSPTVYAPPPGPPPEILAAQGAANQYSNGNTIPSTDDQFAVNQVRQMESDEEYARKIWAREEERHRRREERGSGADLSSAERQRQKQRKQSYDPTLAALGGAPAPHPSGTPGPAINPQAPLPPSASDLANEEKQWNTKEIYWKGRSQRIIVQNENGPCSLIALCNVLLLRGTVQITPEDRPAVSYSYLSSLLGEHLIDAISTNPSAALDLEAALSILPQTQHGLDVNVKFSAIDAFATESEQNKAPIQESLAEPSASSSSAAVLQAPVKTDKNAQRGELALFKLCKVPLVHGWLADQADAETWAAIVERTGDYDKALDRVVAGDEIAKTAEGEASFDIRAAQVMDTISPEQRVVVQDALVIRRFLESTATQLTYPGLYALSTSLERGVLYALFRNSHLSVLYRPTEEELLQAASASDNMHSQPQLYQLVTDSTLENEDSIVWESVEDIDGSASRFFDGKFRLARVQDFVGRGSVDDPNQVNEDADFAYAQQLQERERERADRHRRAVDTYRNKRTQSNNNANANSSGGSGNLIARMLQNRKSSKHAPSNSALHQNVDSMLGGGNNANGNEFVGSSRPPPASTSNEPAPGEEYTQKDGKKWWKKMF
ncbi:hypothetical protein L7F22_042096 [Adiantum nelumboides]|nr:hypothetical protein [Adiantum nelumboides]